MDYNVLEQNRRLVKEISSLCSRISDLTQGLADSTINKSIQALQRFIQEFSEYDKLRDVANLCDEISFLDLLSQAFNSLMRNVPKEKKIDFQIKDEGKSIQKDDYDSVLEKYKIHECFSCLGLVPQLLMDNAVKYAISGTSISVDIHQTPYRKTIILTNIGPLLESGEEQTIFSLNENYRGRNARETQVPGQGLGLKIANLIVASHGWRDATISVRPSDSIGSFQKDGIPYGEFSIEVSIREIDENSKPPQDTIVQEMLGEYIEHEYSRTNPLLGKHAREIYEESFSRKECYHAIDCNSLRQNAYVLYKTVMNHLFKCSLINGEDAKSDSELPGSSKRFDNQIITLARRAASFNNSSLTVRVERGSFSLTPMHTSIHVFYYLLSEYIASYTEGELTISFIEGNRFNGQTIEIFAPEGKSFDGISSSQWDVMSRIISNHSASLNRRDALLTITKNGYY